MHPLFTKYTLSLAGCSGFVVLSSVGAHPRAQRMAPTAKRM